MATAKAPVAQQFPPATHLVCTRLPEVLCAVLLSPILRQLLRLEDLSHTLLWRPDIDMNPFPPVSGIVGHTPYIGGARYLGKPAVIAQSRLGKPFVCQQDLSTATYILGTQNYRSRLPLWDEMLPFRGIY